MPISRRFSNPGVKRRRNWDQVISGLTFFFARIQRCWILPVRLGSCQWRNAVCHAIVLWVGITLGYKGYVCKLKVYKYFGRSRDVWHTSSLLNNFQIIWKNELGVAVCPPDLNPMDHTREWIDSFVKRKSKPLPFIMLINSKDIVDTRSPKAPALKSTSSVHELGQTRIHGNKQQQGP